MDQYLQANDEQTPIPDPPSPFTWPVVHLLAFSMVFFYFFIVLIRFWDDLFEDGNVR